MPNGPLRIDPGLLNREGRGVKNGIPYGEQLLKEQDDVDQQYGDPRMKGPLRAQTRKALGR